MLLPCTNTGTCAAGRMPHIFRPHSVHSNSPLNFLGGLHAQVALQYHVRVFIPCYKESLEIVQRTVLAALDAELPGGCERTVYLCDDGKDPEKRHWVQVRGLLWPAGASIVILAQHATECMPNLAGPFACTRGLLKHVQRLTLGFIVGVLQSH